MINATNKANVLHWYNNWEIFSNILTCVFTSRLLFATLYWYDLLNDNYQEKMEVMNLLGKNGSSKNIISNIVSGKLWGKWFNFRIVPIIKSGSKLFILHIYELLAQYILHSRLEYECAGTPSFLFVANDIVVY